MECLLVLVLLRGSSAKLMVLANAKKLVEETETAQHKGHAQQVRPVTQTGLVLLAMWMEAQEMEQCKALALAIP